VVGFEWIGKAASWAVAWIPRLVHVKANEAGVKFIASRTRVIGPGLHLYWPVTTDVVKTQTARCVLELSAQPLITNDGVTVLAGGIVAYRVTDVHKFLVDNYDADTNLGETAEVAIRRAVIEKNLPDLQRARADIDNALTREVQKLMNDFGVEVLFARLADLAPTQVLYLAGSAIGTPVRPDETKTTG
jgi:regulator of protease activity HflC (stomatin/prohibitin superfamily)